MVEDCHACAEIYTFACKIQLETTDKEVITTFICLEKNMVYFFGNIIVADVPESMFVQDVGLKGECSNATMTSALLVRCTGIHRSPVACHLKRYDANVRVL